MRIALGKILLEHPDILLLDEPTNYLDVEARLWLKSYLIGYSGGCILVSHDRYFLDATTTEVWNSTEGDSNVIRDPSPPMNGSRPKS